MASPRKRSTSQGFSPVEGESSPVETSLIEDDSESTSREMFETFSHTLESQSQEVEEIVPTEDPGPRFVVTETQDSVPVATHAPQIVAPRRHPRNIPKFSRVKK